MAGMAILAPALFWAALALPVRAQVDPDRRRLLQIGYDQPTVGPAPPGGYIFFYSNEPRFIRPDWTLRTALAPTYVDNELGIKNVLGTRNDVGIGLAGGGFSDDYYEVRQGHYFPEESFTGDGASTYLALYRTLNPGQKVPLNLVLKDGVYGSFYSRNSQTAADFKRPPDHWDDRFLAGLRLGGSPPRLQPGKAAELSTWYETYWRDRGAGYGYDDDRQLERTTQLFWTRALLHYRLESGKRIDADIQAGGSTNPDRLDTYRIGGLLPFASEFPLSLPGYYNGELSVQRYLLFGGQYGVPLDSEKLFEGRVFADAADVSYLPGLGQPGPWNEGVGTGVDINIPGDVWKIVVNYAHGIEAIRSGHRGADSVSLLTQFDFEALRKRVSHQPSPEPIKPEGMGWLFRLFGP